MICLRNLLFRFSQYYGIFFGFTYALIDFKKCEIKFNNNVKINVYLLNFITLLPMSIYKLKGSIKFFVQDIGLTVIQVIPNIVSVFVLPVLICRRLKEEQFHKSVFETFISRQKRNFEKLQHSSVDKCTNKILIVQISILFALTVYRLGDCIIYIIEGYWWNATVNYLDFNFTWLSHYILWHHGFILCYINYIFLKLNTQLDYYDQVLEMKQSFAEIYIENYCILQKWNTINSFSVFIALLQVLVSQIFSIFEVVHYIVIVNMTSNIDILHVINLSVSMFELINIFLYYLICERISKTLKDTGRIIMEYSTRKQNREVNKIIILLN